MPQKLKPLATAFYGLAVVTSGLFSLLSREGGTAGLWFGLVMGGSALGAACLLWANRRLLGTTVAWVAVGFVGGWFVYDSFIKKGFGHADFRMHLMIVLSLLEAVVLCLPTKQKSKTPSAN